MTSVAKGSFPGCLRKKIKKKRIKNFHHKRVGMRWENNLKITEQIIKNFKKFRDVFGDSDEVCFTLIL